jgi:hypothetical protein
MSLYGFCYYYSRTAEDEANGYKTYIGQFVERDEVYYLTDLELTVDADGNATDSNAEYLNYLFYYMNGGDRKFKTVAEIEQWLKEDYTDKGIKLYSVEDTDGIDGVSYLNQKVSIARQWFSSSWGIDLDQLRALVQERQNNININELMKQIDEVE